MVNAVLCILNHNTDNQKASRRAEPAEGTSLVHRQAWALPGPLSSRCGKACVPTALQALPAGENARSTVKGFAQWTLKSARNNLKETQLILLLCLFLSGPARMFVPR